MYQDVSVQNGFPGKILFLLPCVPEKVCREHWAEVQREPKGSCGREEGLGDQLGTAPPAQWPLGKRSPGR